MSKRVLNLGFGIMGFRHYFVSLLVIGALMLGGCTPDQISSASSPSGSTSGSATQTTSVTATPTNPASLSSSAPLLAGQATVVMTVNGSPITIEVDGTDAPVTAGNFVDLVQRGVYDGLMFHRVVRQPEPFVVQGGDPQSKNPNSSPERLGTGGFIDPKTGEERYIPLEIKPQGAEEPIYGKTLESNGITAPPVLKHTRGAIAMARSQQPNSASSQFYFALSDLTFLDGNYAVFGYVTNGIDVVDKIQQGDRIESAKVTKGIENLKTSSNS